MLVPVDLDPVKQQRLATLVKKVLQLCHPDWTSGIEALLLARLDLERGEPPLLGLEAALPEHQVLGGLLLVRRLSDPVRMECHGVLIWILPIADHADTSAGCTGPKPSLREADPMLCGP